MLSFESSSLKLKKTNSRTPRLKAALVALGREAKQANAACNLAAELTQAAVIKRAYYNPGLSAAQRTAGARGDSSNANGHYYSLNEHESNELMKVLPCPLDQSIFYNATNVVDQDDFMGIRVYTFGVMVNRG